MSYNPYNYWSDVIQDLGHVLENEEYYDVIIKVGEGSDVNEIRAHSLMLRARCPYFKRALSSNWEEKDDDGNYIFKKPNISTDVFQIILRYLYTGIVNYSQYSEDVIVQCLVAADELGLDKLIEHIQKYLIDNGELLHKDPVTALEIAHKHESFEELKDYCLEIISDEPKLLFSSQKFPLLEKPIITMVLQRDDLNMEEIDIWESLLRWLFVHYLKICKDDSTWSSEDLTSVKETIQECIPSIRFYDISKEDFYLKVYPYKDLLPQDLLNDVLRFHMVPNSTPSFDFKPPRSRNSDISDSVLINYNVFKLFAKWINKKSNDYTRKNMPYQFELLLRGTENGFDASKFHQLCDKKGATISFARVKNSKQVIGGYNPLRWSQNGQYGNTSDSFLFKIADNDINSAQIGRCNDSSNAVYNHSSYGPTFGSGHDLRAQGNTWNTSNGNSYSNISMPSNFTIDEYEVFQVVNKNAFFLL